MKISRTGKIVTSVLALFLAGFAIPEGIIIPLQGATTNDWNHKTFWYEPWGRSGVHKGIDIFGKRGTPVLSPTYGMVIFKGELELGGKVVLIAGPKWRLHYLAHLDEIILEAEFFVGPGSKLGTSGTTGNAFGKQPHVHYSIVSIFPYIWRMTGETQGWKKIFFLNPHEELGDL